MFLSFSNLYMYMYVESSLIEWLRFQAILDNIKYRAIRYFVGTVDSYLNAWN